MNVLTLAIGVLVTLGGALAYFWSYITYHFSHHIKKWIADNISSKVADMLADFIFFVDDKIFVPTKQVVKNLWRNFNKYIIDQTTTYQDNGNGTYNAKTKLITPSKIPGKYNVTTQTRQVEWEDLPSSVRKKQLRENADKIVTPDKDIMAEQYRTVAETKTGIPRQELVLEH